MKMLKFYKIRRRVTRSSYIFFISLILICTSSSVISASEDGCPWGNDIRVPSTIKTRCQCARTPSANSQLSIQCNDVEASQLISVLTHRGKIETLELLYLNASKITDANGQIPSRIFRDIKMVSLQISGCGIKTLHPDAFRGQENTMKHLSLTMNSIKDIPKSALDRLKNLNLLDLSHNRITTIKDGTFEQLNKLTTLKLNDNSLNLEPKAFKGIESTLKNLNLKSTRTAELPEAIKSLSTLAFLDLAQNRIRELDQNPFKNLHSLTALNLERNLLQTLPATVFKGVNDTLSSLSLLNNLITIFPRDALEYLHELRVLDLGFNVLKEIPNNAFQGLNALTLLALDGNPLATLPEKPFARLNTTLRGLSLGGKFLNCDCQISWIADWVTSLDLQVTSRERNPQFCGNPPELRLSNFYQLKVDDLKCNQNTTYTTSSVKISTSTSYPKLTTEDFESGHENTKIQPDNTEEDSENTSVNGYNKNREITFLSHKENGNPHPSNNDNENTKESIDELIASAESKPSTLRPFVKRIQLSPTESENKNHTSSVVNVTVKKFPQTIKPFTPKKAIITTTSSTSTVVSSSASNGKPNVQIASTIEPETSPPTRKPTNLGIIPEDDSNIPIITGIGHKNAGSVVQVRVTPAPTTTTIFPRKYTKVQPPPTTTTVHPIITSAFDEDNGVSHSHHIISQTTHGRRNSLIFTEKSDIEIEEIERNGDSILVQWRSAKIYSFRIIYRIFGEDAFRHGPPLAPSEREYRIQNIPYNECIVVCVVPYEEIVYNEISASAASVPPGSQCRELKPASPSALMSHMDKITIGASAAICFTVVVAILIFIGVTRRATKRKRQDSPIISKIPPSSYPTPSPGPLPISAGSMNLAKDWDQLSGISSRSIPRARVYNTTMDAPQIGNGPPRGVIPHSHHHHYQTQQHPHQRSVPDGHSTHRSYLSSHHAHHNHSYNKHSSQLTAGISGYLNNQSRLLRASLGPRSTQDALAKQMGSSTKLHRHLEQNKHKKKKGQRLSACDSLNTLSGYDTPDNWTDHDMDVYIAQNATRRDLVQL